MSSADDLSQPIEQLRVTIVTIVTTETTQAIVAELRKESIGVELATATVIDEPPSSPIYIISLDSAISGVVADRLVRWAQSTELRPGLIGMVEAGTVRENEALLAAGFDDVVMTPVSFARADRARARRVPPRALEGHLERPRALRRADASTSMAASCGSMARRSR